MSATETVGNHPIACIVVNSEISKHVGRLRDDRLMSPPRRRREGITTTGIPGQRRSDRLPQYQFRRAWIGRASGRGLPAGPVFPVVSPDAIAGLGDQGHGDQPRQDE